jgi:hypothetical protein
MSDDVNPLHAGATPLTLDGARGMLFEQPKEDKPAAPVTEQQPPNQAQEAEPAAEEAQPEQEATEQEEDELPPLEAPAHWKKAAKELFSSLPRELQSAAIERERERETGLSRAMQEAAEKRKSAESELLATQNERQRYQQQLNTFVPLLQKQLQGKYANVDWTKVARESPAEYVALKAEYDQDMLGLQRAHLESQALAKQQQDQAEAQRKEFAQREWSQLVEAKPEFKDEAKWRKFRDETRSYALSIGYEPADYDSNMSHKNLIVLEKAMLFDRAQKAVKESVAKPVPKVQAPGTARTKADRAAQDRDAIFKRAEQTGDIRDYARLLRTR